MKDMGSQKDDDYLYLSFCDLVLPKVPNRTSFCYENLKKKREWSAARRWGWGGWGSRERASSIPALPSLLNPYPQSPLTSWYPLNSQPFPLPFQPAKIKDMFLQSFSHKGVELKLVRGGRIILAYAREKFPPPEQFFPLGMIFAPLWAYFFNFFSLYR